MKMYKLMCSIFIVGFFFLFGCRKNDFRLEENAEDFFFLENKEAIMPVWVEGNTASKNFIIHVHGGPGGESMSSFNILGAPFTDLLEEKYANVYYDQRGSGSAQGNASIETFTEEQFAEDLHKLIIILKEKYGQEINVFLIGTSWGGRLCSTFLLNPIYQQEVNGWISVSGAINNLTTANSGKDLLSKYASLYIEKEENIIEWTKILDWSASMDTIINEKDWGDQNSYAWDAMDLVKDSLNNETNIDLSRVAKSIFFSPSNLSLTLTQSSNFPEDQMTVFNDLDDMLSAITLPSLFMAGKFDFVVPPKVAETAYNNISSEKKGLIIFDHSAHAIPFNESEKFVNAVINFVEENQ